MRFVILLLVSFSTLPTLGQTNKNTKKKNYSTHANPPKPLEPSRLHPGEEVPQNIDQWDWEITDTVRGQKIVQGEVPVFRLDADGRTMIGTLNVGTKMKIDLMKVHGFSHYYGYPLDKIKPLNQKSEDDEEQEEEEEEEDDEGKKKKKLFSDRYPRLAWVHGRYIKPVPKQEDKEKKEPTDQG